MHAARSVALALLLTVAIAGCTTLTDTPGTNDPTATETPLSIDTPTASPTPTPDVHPVTTPERWYTTGDSNLDEHEEPHGIRIVNDGNETVAIVTLRITRENTDTLVRKTAKLAPTEGHYGILNYKANYTITATVGNHTATEHIPKATFDCNDSTSTFTITNDNLTVQTLSTTVDCSTASTE